VSAGTMKAVRMYGVAVYGAVMVLPEGAMVADKLLAYCTTKPHMTKLTIAPEGRAELDSKDMGEYRFRWRIKAESVIYMDLPKGLCGFNEIEVLTKYDELPFVFNNTAPLLFAKSMCPTDTFKVEELPVDEVMVASQAMHDACVAADLAHGIVRDEDNLAEQMKAALDQYGNNPPPEVMEPILKAMADRSPPHLKHLYERKVGGPNVLVRSAEGLTYLPCGVTDFDDAAVILEGKLSTQPLIRVCSLDQPTWKAVDPEKNANLYNMGYRGAWVFRKGALGEKSDDSTMVGFCVLDGLPVLVKTAESINPAGELAIPREVYETLGGSTEGKSLMDREAAEAFNLKHGVRLNAASSVPRTAN
jgi:hypothetical protein